MARRPKADPLSPAERARADARHRADLGWLDLKAAAGVWGRVEVVSALDQQMRITHASGAEAKIWRVGNAFAAALDGVVIGKEFAALDALLQVHIRVKIQEHDRKRTQSEDH